MRPFFALFILPLAGLGIAQPPASKEPAKDLGPITVVDTDGKEGVLKNWKITQGTRRYVLQAEVKGEKPDPAKAGQEFIEFREDSSTTLKDGILTLIPLTSVSKLDYDVENRTVALTLLLADKTTAKLTGPTKYVNINKLTVDGSVDLGGDLGLATIKYEGGKSAAKPGVASFRLPFNQPAPEPKGLSYLLNGIDENKTVHKVYDLKVLYRTAGGVDRISPILWFKETAKIPLTKIVTMVQPEDSNQYQLKLADGKQLPPLALVETGFPEDGSAAQLIGLIGKVPAGYKMFPMHTFTELRREGE